MVSAVVFQPLSLSEFGGERDGRYFLEAVCIDIRCVIMPKLPICSITGPGCHNAYVAYEGAYV